MAMTRKEKLAFDRLEIENKQLRASNNRHLEVYRDQALELIELRTKFEMFNRMLTELMNEAAF